MLMGHGSSYLVIFLIANWVKQTFEKQTFEKHTFEKHTFEKQTFEKPNIEITNNPMIIHVPAGYITNSMVRHSYEML